LTGLLFKFSFDLKKNVRIPPSAQEKKLQEMLQTWIFSSGLIKYSAGGREDYVLFKGVILRDIPDTARFSKDRQYREQDYCGMCWFCGAKHW
jgi:hypothetical protein